MLSFLKKIFGTAQSRMVKRYRRIVKEINILEEQYQKLSETELKAKTDEFKARLKAGETVDQLLPEAYAAVKNACRRMMGTDVHVSGYDQKWDMIPFDVQLVGAIAMHQNAIAEMMTGEGKTLTAVMPCYLNALTGRGVHLVTVNDYLAKRDCYWVGSVLRYLGITTSALTNDVGPNDRHAIYAADVVYGTASEFGFDYLRDNSLAQRASDQVQRDHYYAIIDEIDSVLIDEARTPLIISGPVPVSRQMYDTLKDAVTVLVRNQRDLCNRLASEARKVLEDNGYTRDSSPPTPPKDKAVVDAIKDAYHKLWLVTKGTPRNKVLKRLQENPDMRAAIDEWDLYYYQDQNKSDRIVAMGELFITVDEKASEFELTDKGIAAWEKADDQASQDDFVMLDLGHEYAAIDQDRDLNHDQRLQKKLELQEDDARRKERAHNLRQLLRAHLLMERDVDYIVQDGKVVIIDEHTGRPQPGRRFSDGLHQAIEAKEGVAIQKETQTYATITLQNYFRMYEKLAGMSGTAVTEAAEFKEIYKLEVLEIPTHNPCVREDFHDEVYMTEREKYAALLASVKEIHAKGRPILIGTESVEVSEKLSRVFRQSNLPHTVLNAKYHEQEASIIAAAGQGGAITIATNMAGRGTDIKLGAGIATIGGLHVIGTTRQNARRVDRQLRGRCARQGDPGTSRFYLSFEDQLMRFFAGGRITQMLQRFRPPEGEPISAGMLNSAIETAQKRVEQRNYTIRKHTLQYDDVMNKQRQEIYSFRNDLLHTKDPIAVAEEIAETVCHDEAARFFDHEKHDGEGYRQLICSMFPVALEENCFADDKLSAEEIGSTTAAKVVEAFRIKVEAENAKVQAPEGQSPAGEAARSLMLRQLDDLWQKHLLSMDHLRAEVSLHALAQKDPLIEFKQEAFVLFGELSQSLRRDIAQKLFKFRIIPYDRNQIDQILAKLSMERDRSFMEEAQPAPQQAVAEPVRQDEEEKPSPVLVGPKVGRNDLCPCGSGKKYKKCCGINAEEEETEEPKG